MYFYSRILKGHADKIVMEEILVFYWFNYIQTKGLIHSLFIKRSLCFMCVEAILDAILWAVRQTPDFSHQNFVFRG